jgi:hypothetical protein
MDKHIRRTVTITITETWTITWADGAEQTVVYQVRQSYHVLPADPNEPQGWAELKTRGTNSSPCAPTSQTGTSETVDRTA